MIYVKRMLNKINIIILFESVKYFKANCFLLKAKTIKLINLYIYSKIKNIFKYISDDKKCYR